MAKKPDLPFNDPTATSGSTTQPTAGSYGYDVEVDEKTLDPDDDSRVIRSVSQAYEVTETDITDAQKLVANAALITNLKQGARPYNPATLKNLNEGHKTNISTRAYATELNRAAPRLYQPILSASTLTAAQLPVGWPDAANKTAFFRSTITEAIRGWRKQRFFWEGLSREATDYAYVFAACLDKYDWRPSIIRMDRGFMPAGTEIMEENPGRFTAKVDYKVSELLDLAKKGGSGWNKEAVAFAVENAELPATNWKLDGYRKWEELIGEASWNFTYTKGVKVIKARFLFALEATGKVSQYILNPDAPVAMQLLCEKLDIYDSMNDFVTALVFSYGDGTLQGARGAGHILYDMAVQLEQLRCDNLDNLKMGNKLKIQVPDPKDINQVKLVVNSTAAILSNGQFSQNIGGIAPATESYAIAENLCSKWMSEGIGSYLPPVPTAASKAANQIAGAAIEQNEDTQRALLDGWLGQIAYVVQMMTKRLCDKDSPDKVAKATRKTLLDGRNGLALTEEEIDLLVNQPSVQSVVEFTQWFASQRGAFAASVKGDPRFNQTVAARMQAEGVPSGGVRLADEIVVETGDPATTTAQVRAQILENTTMALGIEIPVLVTDSDLIHLDALKQPLDDAIKAGMLKQAQVGLNHAAAHFQSGLSKKTLPDSNKWKAQIATWEHAIQALAQEQAQAQQAQALQQQQQVPPMAQFPSQPAVAQ